MQGLTAFNDFRQIDMTGMIGAMEIADIKERQALINKHDLCEFIRTEVYPSNFEPGAEKYILGSIHERWNEHIEQEKQMVLLSPRDHLKSFFATESRTIQRIKYYPGSRVYIISETDPQAMERLENIKKIIEYSDTLKYLKPSNPESWSKKAIQCTNGSVVKVAGFWSGLRGKHPHLLILDDPIDEQVIYSPDQNQKSIDRFFQTIYPMAEPDTQVIVIGTRQCEGDLFDSLKSPQWKTFEYRAIVDEARHITLFPEKWDWVKLMNRKDSIVNSPKGGMRIWLKEYMNDVTAIKGNIVKYENFRFWLNKDERKPETGRWTSNIWTTKPDKLNIFTGWDLSVGKKITDDATSGVTIGVDPTNGEIYVLDVINERLRMPGRLAAIKDKGESFPEVLKIGIEENVFQDDTVQEAIKASHLPIVGIKTQSNKLLRLESACTVFVNGKVYCRPEHEALMEQIIAFPRGSYDDMFDAFDIALFLARTANKKIKLLHTGVDPSDAMAEITKGLPNKDELIQKLSETEYLMMGFKVRIDRNKQVCTGPVWLMGRGLVDAMRHVVARSKGVQESNRDYDMISSHQRIEDTLI